MADGFTILPEFGNSQGANTAVLPENNQVVDTYFQVQENKYRDKLFNYKKTQDEIARKAQALDFDTGEVWQQDQPLIMDKIKELIDYTHKNPDSYDAASEKYADFDKRQREINFLINKSKHDKAIYDGWLNKSATDPNFQDDFETIKGGLDQFKVTDINERNYIPPVPAPTFNPYEAWKLVEGDIGTMMDTKEGQDKGAGNYEYVTTESFDPTQRKQAIEAIWDNNIKKTAQHITRDYNALPSDSPEKQQFPTARDYGIYILDKTYPTVKGTKSQIKPRKYAPTSGGGGSTSDSGIEFIAQKANDLNNPNSSIYKKATVVTANGTKKEVSVTDTFSGKTITIKNPDPVDAKQYPEIETTVDAIYNIDGKLYAAPLSSRTSKGSIAIKDMIPIDNIEDQVIVPYVNTEYGSSPNTAQLADNTLKLYRQIRGEKQSDNTDSQKYDAKIESGIEAMMKANNMTREQVIAELKRTKRIQ